MVLTNDRPVNWHPKLSQAFTNGVMQEVWPCIAEQQDYILHLLGRLLGEVAPDERTIRAFADYFSPPLVLVVCLGGRLPDFADQHSSPTPRQRTAIHQLQDTPCDSQARLLLYEELAKGVLYSWSRKCIQELIHPRQVTKDENRRIVAAWLEFRENHDEQADELRSVALTPSGQPVTNPKKYIASALESLDSQLSQSQIPDPRSVITHPLDKRLVLAGEANISNTVQNHLRAFQQSMQTALTKLKPEYGSIEEELVSHDRIAQEYFRAFEDTFLFELQDQLEQEYQLDHLRQRFTEKYPYLSAKSHELLALFDILDRIICEIREPGQWILSVAAICLWQFAEHELRLRFAESIGHRSFRIGPGVHYRYDTGARPGQIALGSMQLALFTHNYDHAVREGWGSQDEYIDTDRLLPVWSSSGLESVIQQVTELRNRYAHATSMGQREYSTLRDIVFEGKNAFLEWVYNTEKERSMVANTQIFLCYAEEDVDTVLDLYEKLTDAGFRPWMNKKDIVGGEKWKPAIEKAIGESSLFLACLSIAAASKRGFIQKEIARAKDILKELLDTDIYLIPVRLEDCGVPENLSEHQWIDLWKDDGWQNLMQAILVGIARREQ